MALYVKRMLASGQIRFGVAPRSVDGRTGRDEAWFSTTNLGEFRRRGGATAYFGEERPDASAVLTPEGVTSRSSIWEFVLPPEKTPAVWGGIVLFFLGLFFLLIGLLVLVNKGRQGLAEIILGLIMAGIPVVYAAKRRSDLRAVEERNRKERTELEERNRRLAGELATRLAALPQKHDTKTLDDIRRDRTEDPVPYEAIAGFARQAVLLVAFDELSRYSGGSTEAIAQTIWDVSDAVGLSADDRRTVMNLIYQKLVWHLLADDRLSDAHVAVLSDFRRQLGLIEADLLPDDRAAADFARLRKLQDLPGCESPIQLKFHEVCHHVTEGGVARPSKGDAKWEIGAPKRVLITSNRIVVGEGKTEEYPLSSIYDVEVDSDEGVIRIETAPRKKKFIAFALPDPIYTGMIVEMLTTALRRPRF